jgi:hypothetical protein
MAGLLGVFFGRKMALTHIEVGLHAMKVIASGGLWLGGWRLSAAGGVQSGAEGVGQYPCRHPDSNHGQVPDAGWRDANRSEPAFDT